MSGFSSYSKTGNLNSAFLVSLFVLVLNVLKAIIDTHLRLDSYKMGLRKKK